jgi:hypothetical protein
MLVPAVCCAALAVAQDWTKPAFPDWRDQTVLRLITDSPWAKVSKVKLEWTKRGEQTITYKDVPGADGSPNKPYGSPIGGIGTPRVKYPTQAEILIRWASALPVRQATAIYKQREGKLDAAKLNELIGVPSPDYVLEVRGVPSEIAHMGAESVEQLARQSTFLRTATGRVIKPVRAQVALQGATLTLLVHFPRTEPIQAEEREVEFLGNLQVFEFKEKFRLSAMTYLGHLEL